MSVCAVEWCDYQVMARGYCSGHLKRLKRGANLNAPWGPTSKRYPRPPRFCSVEWCENKLYCKSLCKNHYARQLQGRPLVAPWRKRSDRLVDKAGYVMLYKPDHPKAKRFGHVMEHRLVMEQILGRYLYVGENVHHINGIKDDNRAENLELWCTPQPAGQRVEDLAQWVAENYPEFVASFITTVA